MRLTSASSKLLIFCVVTISAIGCTKPAPIATTDTEASVRTACSAEGALNLHVPSPDWRDQVVYMLFIDRFDDGDPTNNDQGYGEHDPQKGTHYSGGDLQGVINRIDYLKSLGATALWISPPVESQWWSTPYQAAGWHGYWATNFKKVDAHFGQLEDYERLSHQLHCNDMYLIQDIVANHTANWFTYDGNYNSNDTAMNFRLLEPELAQTPAAPFNMFNRLDPEHAAANIYHWSPAISDYADTSRRYSSQLGSLADINTENPVVIKELKETYKYWMDEVGVDGFRVDTVAYVPHEFWHQWAHGDDGIYAHANTLGKAHFLTFGEAILLSDPFDDTGEKEIVTFMSQDGKEGLNSMLGFPLYKDIHRVLGEGESSQALAYRLEKFMEIYPDPFTTPNFVDTHDEPRFLATAPVAALKQALAVVFTIPGIPIIYQGTEQALPETRMAMYQGGHRNAAGSFDPQSPMYRYLQALTKIRREHAVLTRGSLDVIAADTAGPGLLAYRREYAGEVVFVVMNTANHSILVNQLKVDAEPGRVLEPVFAEGFDARVTTDAAGHLNMQLPPRAIVILRLLDEVVAVDDAQAPPVMIDPMETGIMHAKDFEISGKAGAAARQLQLLINGNLDEPIDVVADAKGAWRAIVPVRNLGASTNYAQIYAPRTGTLSDRVSYQTHVQEAELTLTVDDPADDGRGPRGDYIGPQHSESGSQREIESAHVRIAGHNLELTLTMAEVTDVWVPPNGFDNVTITTFVDLPDVDGERRLPLLYARMPADLDWDLGHFASGWSSYTFTTAGATTQQEGEKLGVSPKVSADKANRTIRFLYEGSKLGVADWSNASIYVTTWDAAGEGGYRDITPEPGKWYFSGGNADDPRVMDDIMIRIGDSE